MIGEIEMNENKRRNAIALAAAVMDEVSSLETVRTDDVVLPITARFWKRGRMKLTDKQLGRLYNEPGLREMWKRETGAYLCEMPAAAGTATTQENRNIGGGGKMSVISHDDYVEVQVKLPERDDYPAILRVFAIAPDNNSADIKFKKVEGVDGLYIDHLSCDDKRVSILQNVESRIFIQ